MKYAGNSMIIILVLIALAFLAAIPLSMGQEFSIVRNRYQDRSGMVLYLPMNEGAGKVINDHSGNGVKGSITGGQWIDDAVFGKVLSFNSHSYVNISRAYDLEVGANCSIMFWIKANQPSNAWVIKRGDSFYVQFWSDGRIIGGMYTNGTSHEITSSSRFEIGKWYFVVLEKSGNSERLYVNSKLEAEARINGTFTLSPQQDTIIGWESNAYIRDLRIYARGLTPSDISYIYNQSNEIRISNLWPGQKVELYDSSGALIIGSDKVNQQGELSLSLAEKAFPLAGSFKVYDGGNLLYQTQVYKDIWGGDEYVFSYPANLTRSSVSTTTSSVSNIFPQLASFSQNFILSVSILLLLGVLTAVFFLALRRVR